MSHGHFSLCVCMHLTRSIAIGLQNIPYDDTNIREVTHYSYKEVVEFRCRVTMVVS